MSICRAIIPHVLAHASECCHSPAIERDIISNTVVDSTSVFTTSNPSSTIACGIVLIG